MYDPSLPIHRHYGPYEVLARIGTGSTGVVYRARDTTLGRLVALKVLSPRLMTEHRDQIARFQREAYLLAALNHPNIAAIYGAGEAHDEHFLVLELIEGQTLDVRLRSRPIPITNALMVAKQIVDALAAAHAKGIVHRDLKPANVGFATPDHVKVLDFGLAKAIHGDLIDVLRDAKIHVASGGTPRGTPAYLSPEQIDGRPADERSDVWAFGCTFFTMLTRRRPFQLQPSDVDAETRMLTGSIDQLTAKAIKSREPDWALVPTTVPPCVVDLLRRCLEKDPSRRLSDLAVARRDIEDGLIALKDLFHRVGIEQLRQDQHD